MVRKDIWHNCDIIKFVSIVLWLSIRHILETISCTLYNKINRILSTERALFLHLLREPCWQWTPSALVCLVKSLFFLHFWTLPGKIFWVARYFSFTLNASCHSLLSWKLLLPALIKLLLCDMILPFLMLLEASFSLYFLIIQFYILM